MASYQQKAASLFGPLGQKAGEQLASEIQDLLLSFGSQESVFNGIVSYERLHMDEFEFANTLEAVLTVHKMVLGILLHAAKIVPSFSLSKRGKEQFDALTAQFRPAPEDPKITEYRKFNQEADATDFQLRLASDAGFRQWANTAN
jgi:hypothetical protein